MPYELPGGQNNRRTDSCIICGSPANIGRGLASGKNIDCSRCGDFSITHEAEEDYCPIKDPKQRAVASYLIHKSQTSGRFLVTDEFFQLLTDHNLPSPTEMSENLLCWIGNAADGRPGKRVTVTYSDPSIIGQIGAFDNRDVLWASNALRRTGLFDGAAENSSFHGHLTTEGWNRIEEIKRAHIASDFAFFARQFKNPDLDTVYEQCLRPAVAETGYELRTVTQRAGLVDAVIEDEIRRCRFLIADLSDDNAGAYWEAGLAEGLGKPVIYVCRAKDGAAEKKTHFDANHRHTVRWDLSSLDDTAKSLKAVIRNTLLGDAKQAP